MKVNGISLNSFGNGQPEDQYLYVDNGASPRRGLRLRYSDFQWQSSNDGITWENINNPYVSYHKGYYAGGYNGNTLSEIDGIDFNNDASINPSSSLSIPRNAIVAISSSSNSYLAGGSINNRIDKFNLDTEACASSSYSLSTPREQGGVAGNGSKAYISGGTISGDVTASIESILYSNDTVSTLSNSLQQKIGYGPASSSSSSIGYISGGMINTSGTNTNIIQKFTYSSESTSIASGTLSVAKRGPSGGNSTDNMFVFGGYTNTTISTIEKMPFSTESSAAISATLSSATYNTFCCDSVYASYVAGSSSFSNVIRKFLFSNETITNLSATLNSGRAASFGYQSRDISL